MSRTGRRRCRVAVVQTVPAEMYVDMDEVRQQGAVPPPTARCDQGGDSTMGEEAAATANLAPDASSRKCVVEWAVRTHTPYIDVERPASVSVQHEVAFVTTGDVQEEEEAEQEEVGRSNGSQLASLSVLLAHPIHLRYQAPRGKCGSVASAGSGGDCGHYAPALLPAPRVYIQCVGGEEEEGEERRGGVDDDDFVAAGAAWWATVERHNSADARGGGRRWNLVPLAQPDEAAATSATRESGGQAGGQAGGGGSWSMQRGSRATSPPILDPSSKDLVGAQRSGGGGGANGAATDEQLQVPSSIAYKCRNGLYGPLMLCLEVPVGRREDAALVTAATFVFTAGAAALVLGVVSREAMRRRPAAID